MIAQETRDRLMVVDDGSTDGSQGNGFESPMTHKLDIVMRQLLEDQRLTFHQIARYNIAKRNERERRI